MAESRLDLEQAHAYKSGVVEKNAKGIEYLFKKNKIEGIHGRGWLIGANDVAVEGADGTATYSAANVLIATGSVPREVPVAATDGERILNSDHILQLDRVPESLVVLGAGAVGTEFASIFASFGSRVTIVEMLPRLLPIEDEDVSKELARAFRKRGIESLTGTRLAGVERADDGLRLALEADGSPDPLATEMLLVAVGRAPVTEGLGLEEIGVETEKGYVKVDGRMRTSVDGVYAIGDVVQTPWLAHVASAERARNR